MKSSDQTNYQSTPGLQGSDQAMNQNQQRAIDGEDPEQGLDMLGDDGFSYGEVRRLDRQGHAAEGNRQSGAAESGSRQGGNR